MIDEFHYVVAWRASSPHPGSHSSRLKGGIEEFAGHVPFMSTPHARHIDLKASFTNPFETLLVRNFHQKSNIPVVVLADFSASMGFNGQVDKRDLVARFITSAAWSAFRHGDRFGAFMGDDAFIEGLSMPIRHYKGGLPGVYERFLNAPRKGRSPRGLIEAAARLGRQKSLVFLVSDFHLAEQQMEALLEPLARHDVVPIIVWDSAEYSHLPDYGLVLAEDPETGETRRYFMRPALRDRIKERFIERKKGLEHFFRTRGISPFFMVDRFDPEALTRFFVGGR